MTPKGAISIGTIVAVVLIAVLKALWDKRKKEKADAKILNTAPDDPAGVADIDERERVQGSADQSRPK